MFCQDHSQLCCSDCVLLNHRQCTNLSLISESVSQLSVDMQQLSSKIQAILAELTKLTKTQEASIQSIEGSYIEKVQEIRELREKLNAALDKLEITTLKELDEIRTILLTSLKKDVDNCGRLKDELQQLGEAVQGLHDKNKKEMEFITSIKCQDKIQESESYLKENPVKVKSLIIFKANISIEQYLSQQTSLGRIIDSMESLSLAINPDQVLHVKRKTQYNVNISEDKGLFCYIMGICSLPGGQVIVADRHNNRVKMLNQHYDVSSHCDVSGPPFDICQITSSEVAVTVDKAVQFISVINQKLKNGRKVQLPHNACGIAFHQGALYVTSGIAIYHYTLTGSLVKKLYEDASGSFTVWKCAVSPARDRIYVTNETQNKLITLATDGTLLSTFMDSELLNPQGLHVTPAGQVIICGFNGHTVIQVDREGRKKLATLVSHHDGLPASVCYNMNTHQIIVGLESNNIKVMDLQ
ncbi:hypothetical protein DPMN_145539 [Dreissena polymorpha]|uniref:B box-type domain-containing protein n=2 Tax=Dreissena polymorpha TaxID=45954 RepID=A0A9D4IYX2_DREPO|nr:hypothetical protein DPMN_145539 [Dreissena polymorpha]